MVESGLVRDRSENAQSTTIFSAATAQSNILISKHFIDYHVQKPLWTFWNRGMWPFTSFQQSRNHSSGMFHNLTKMTQLFGEQKSNTHVHHFIIGQVAESLLVINTRWRPCMAAFSHSSSCSVCVTFSSTKVKLCLCPSSSSCWYSGYSGPLHFVQLFTSREVNAEHC